MKPLMLFVLLLPLYALSQAVQPVISKDYLALIRDSSRPKTFLVDTTNDVKNSLLKTQGTYTGYPVGRIKIKDGHLKMEATTYKSLTITGNYNSTIEIKKVNQLPALQKSYVQGRSQNGILAWKGPETGETFSYGPDLKNLEFDGNNYDYDLNGRLVLNGAGNGIKANVYRNSIFRTASLLSQSLIAQGKYLEHGNQYLLKIKAGQSTERTFIRENRNTTHDFSASSEAIIRWMKFTAAYSDIQSRFSNSNRSGFLNRLYQNSILTPVSFDNAQGSSLGNVQRSYSNVSDNPFFLLENNGNSYFQNHRTGNFVFEIKSQKVKLRVAQSVDRLKHTTHEVYKPGTAFFPNGIGVDRKQRDFNYLLNPSVTIDVTINSDSYNYLRSTIIANYIYGNNQTGIDYANKLYSYRRSSHDFSLAYKTTYDAYELDAGLNLENKAYVSNTSYRHDFFLPAMSVFIRSDDILSSGDLAVKLIGTFNNFNSELPVSTSFSSNQLVRYSAEQSLQFLPVNEVNSFKNLSPIRHKEWSSRMEVSFFRNKYNLSAEFFSRHTSDDIFPVYENGVFNLKNIASHRNTGFEIEANYFQSSKNFSTSHSVSFFKNKDVVKKVRDGYNFTPIAGFSNVNKAIVEGEVLGSIIGNRYLRDDKNNVVIGNDGFPLVNNTPSVIGNPTPDFVMKLANNVSWKRFTLNVDWEWKKGGDIWNGTQAALDYYGRSKTTAQLRNTTDYVFEGVLQDGHVNNIAVKFYDPSLPVDRNRWTRYGLTGIAEEYIQRGDLFKINNIGICYKLNFRKYIQTISMTLYAHNLVIWTAYKGADPNQLLYDQSNANGFDFFNLPSLKSFGFNVSVQF